MGRVGFRMIHQSKVFVHHLIRSTRVLSEVNSGQLTATAFFFFGEYNEIKLIN